MKSIAWNSCLYQYCPSYKSLQRLNNSNHINMGLQLNLRVFFSKWKKSITAFSRTVNIGLVIISRDLKKWLRWRHGRRLVEKRLREFTFKLNMYHQRSLQKKYENLVIWLTFCKIPRTWLYHVVFCRGRLINIQFMCTAIVLFIESLVSWRSCCCCRRDLLKLPFIQLYSFAIVLDARFMSQEFKQPLQS